MKYFAALFIAAALFPTARAAAEGKEYIVKMNPDAPMAISDRCEYVEFSDGLYVTDEEEAKRLYESGAAQAIEENIEAELFGAPDDEFYPEQWYLSETGYEDIIGAGYSARNARIGIIDSGVYAAHPEIEGRISADSYDVVGKTHEMTDTYGHGTLVSGLIGAKTGNGAGIAGMAPDAEIVMIKCFNDKTTKISNVISAVNYAAELNLDVVNMSMGVELKNADSSALFKEAIDRLAASGAVIIASVGNYGTEKLYYPAAYDNVIGVGAVDKSFNRASYSQHNESVFVTAPGSSVYGLWSPLGKEKEYYISKSGTSFAAPYTAAMAAYAKSYDKNLNYEDICGLIKKSAEDAGAAGYDTSYGWGILNPKVFMDNLLGGSRVFASAPSCAVSADRRTLTVSQNAVNLSGRDLKIICALYENGELSLVKESAFADKTVIETDHGIAEDFYIKRFIWDSLGSMKPYYGAART